MYTYKANVKRVIDGDTFDVIIDLGFDTFKSTKIRLDGIDVCETSLRRGAGKAEKIDGKLLKSILVKDLVKNVIVTSKSKGKFGRWLSDVYIKVTGSLLEDLRAPNECEIDKVTRAMVVNGITYYSLVDLLTHGKWERKNYENKK